MSLNANKRYGTLYYLFFFHYPFLDITGFRTEVYADFKDLSSVHFERKVVMLVINLLQSIFRRAVQFKFHYIDELISL